MPARISEADRRLVSAYTEAAYRIKRQLETISQTPQRKIILARIDPILNELEEMTRNYIRDDLPAHFREGSDEAISLLKNLKVSGITGEFTQLHREALQQIANNATQDFGKAITGVRQSADRLITRAEKQKVIAELLVSEMQGAANPTARVKDVFKEAGIVGFQTNNRTFSLDHYSSMLTQTVLAEAHNTGAVTRYMSNGVQYGEVAERSDACPICGPMRGKIVWLGDRRLSPVYHPNCFGFIKPHLGNPSNPIMSPDDSRIPVKTREAMLKKP